MIHCFARLEVFQGDLGISLQVRNFPSAKFLLSIQLTEAKHYLLAVKCEVNEFLKVFAFHATLADDKLALVVASTSSGLFPSLLLCS